MAAMWAVLLVFGDLIAPFDPDAQDFERFQSPNGDALVRHRRTRARRAQPGDPGRPRPIPLACCSWCWRWPSAPCAGAVAGYFGGGVDGVVMRLADLVFAFPPIILAMAVVASLGPGLRNAVLAVVIVAWPAYARVVRSLVLTFRGRDFVAASRLLGASSRRALVVDVMPNVYGPVLVLATLQLGDAILLLSGPQLPRPGRPAAVARVGRDGGRRGAHVRPLVGRDVPRAGDPDAS